MEACPDPRIVDLFLRARICQEFPAYTLAMAREAEIEVLQALELLALAQKALS